MLFVAEYEFEWDTLEAAAAKRLEWEEICPDDFRFIGEYVWQDRDPPFRGVAIFEAESVESVHGFTLHYGPSVKMQAHAASDLMSAIGASQAGDARSIAPKLAPRKRSRSR
jgi:hypothetical protein